MKDIEEKAMAIGIDKVQAWKIINGIREYQS
jgi:hypothetical protein